jgi:release factor glutamine methyltransferase
MTIGDFQRTATAQLIEAGIPSARLDMLILLEDTTGYDRAHLLAHPEHILSDATISHLQKQLTARRQHVPLAYIRGKAFFYGRVFIVNEHVLVPRPETEAMITLLKSIPLRYPQVADIGSGSGCIGITAALELAGAQVSLYDIDPLALMTARQNAKALHAAVTIAHADLLHGVQEPIDIVLANLPYVPQGFTINEAATHEPRAALFAGANGLELYHTFWQQIASKSQKPQYVLTESLGIQHANVTSLARHAGYRLIATEGLIQQFERSKN